MIDDQAMQTAARRLRLPGAMALFQWTSMPLGAFAGLRVERLDGEVCVVRMPGGWRTRNPFKSTYWAAQGMAGEMSTGVMAFLMTKASSEQVRMILSDVEGSFSRRCLTGSRYVCEDGTKARAAIEETLKTHESVPCAMRAVGYDMEGEVISEWTFTWSFRAKSA